MKDPIDVVISFDTTGSMYTAYIQSTSYNRKLLNGTSFLYEVPDFEGAAKAEVPQP